jgi:hypothetical protein
MLDFVDLLSRVPEKDVAKLLGNKTPRYVRGLAEDGILIRVEPGIYNLGASLPALTERRSAKAADEKMRLASEQADGHALKNAQLRGELLPKVEVESMWSRICGEVRSAMLAVSSRIQQRIAGLSRADIEIIDSVTFERSARHSGHCAQGKRNEFNRVELDGQRTRTNDPEIAPLKDVWNETHRVLFTAFRRGPRKGRIPARPR